jgi:hypothetical protein
LQPVENRGRRQDFSITFAAGCGLPSNDGEHVPMPDSALALIVEKSEALLKAIASWNSLPSLPTAALADEARQELRRAFREVDLNSDDFDPLISEKLRELNDALYGVSELTPTLLRDVIAALRAAAVPVHGRPGRPPRYSPEAREYARKLKAENPGMTAKKIKQQTKRKLHKAKLPPDIKSFREWIRLRENGR